MNAVQVQPITFLFLFFTLYLLIAFLLYQYIKQHQRKRAKVNIRSKLVPLSKHLINMNNPKELEERLSKLTDKQFQEYKKQLEKDKYRIGNLGYYLRERFDEMSKHDCRKPFILDIVGKFKLSNQFGMKVIT